MFDITLKKQMRILKKIRSSQNFQRFSVITTNLPRIIKKRLGRGIWMVFRKHGNACIHRYRSGLHATHLRIKRVIYRRSTRGYRLYHATELKKIRGTLFYCIFDRNFLRKSCSELIFTSFFGILLTTPGISGP